MLKKILFLVFLVGLLPLKSVLAAAMITNTSMPEATVGQAYSLQFQATGGQGALIFEKWYSSYPGNEMTLSSSGLFSGTPQTAGTWMLGVRVSDAAGLGTYSMFSFKVNAAGSGTGGGTGSTFVTVSGVTPSSGVLSAGNAINIGWTVANLPASTTATVTLQSVEGEVRREAVRISSSAATVNGSNSLSWTVPSGIANGNYKIMVELNHAFPISGGGSAFPRSETSGLWTLGSGTGGGTGQASLAVTLNPSSPSGNVQPGAVNTHIASFALQATGGNVTINSVQLVSDSSNVNNSINNLQIYQDNITWVAGVTGLTSTDGSLRVITVNFVNPIVVTAGTQTTMDIRSYVSGAASGSFRLGVRNITTSQNVNVTGSFPLYGNTLTVGTSGGTSLDPKINAPDTLPDGTVGQAYSYTFAATGGTAPYTWSIPSNNSINVYPCCFTGFNTQTGVFASASPTGGQSVMPYSGTYQLQLQLTDSTGKSVQKTFQYTIKPTGSTGSEVYEGYVDYLLTGSVAGWAFRAKNNDSKTPSQINIVFENVNDTSKTYGLNTVADVWRPDADIYVRIKYGVSSINVPLGFSANPASVLPSGGSYRIKSATVDGLALQVRDLAQRTITISSTARTMGGYVKVSEDPTVYWITDWGGKMPVLNDRVFFSYGSQWSDVKTITQEELDDYEEVQYIKLSGNARVYKISNGIKYYVTPAAATRLGIDPAKVVTVNSTEFYNYKTGATIK